MTFVLYGLYRDAPLEPEGIALEDPFAPGGFEGGDGFRYRPGAQDEGFWRHWMWVAREHYVGRWGWSWRAAFGRIASSYLAWGGIVVEMHYPAGWRLDVDVLYEWYVEQRRDGPFPGFEDPRLYDVLSPEEERQERERHRQRYLADQRAWARTRPKPWELREQEAELRGDHPDTGPIVVE